MINYTTRIATPGELCNPSGFIHFRPLAGGVILSLWTGCAATAATAPARADRPEEIIRKGGFTRPRYCHK
ncbi:MAG: hypothetical protein MUO42_01660 [Anaerolineaceae bacterium]|nr:hypothetical protein [Anaerolineaceae bacterium]